MMLVILMPKGVFIRLVSHSDHALFVNTQRPCLDQLCLKVKKNNRTHKMLGGK